jgi:hypothetical protein
MIYFYFGIFSCILAKNIYFCVMSYDFIGFKVSKYNMVRISYDELEYKDIISLAHNSGFDSPSQYIKAIAQPCTSCGLDKVVLDKLSTSLNKKYKNTSKFNLFCFVNSVVNKRSYKTKYDIRYELRMWLNIPSDTFVYSHVSPTELNFDNGASDDLLFLDFQYFQ